MIDELVGDALMAERFVVADFERELAQRLKSLQSTGEDDDETLLNLLRRAQHAETFRTLARDVGGRITVEQVADDLSAWPTACCASPPVVLEPPEEPPPRGAPVRHHRLRQAGRQRAGLRQRPGHRLRVRRRRRARPEVYAAFVRKLINWLTVKTGEGDLFEIDTALRPNGNSGLLVTSFEAYANYQQQRGSNTAWTWEHQAMTRARFVLGSPELQARFDAVREAVITSARDASALRKRSSPCASACAPPTQWCPAACLRSSTARAAWSMPNLPCSTWCCRNLAPTPSCAATWATSPLLERAEQVGLLPCGRGPRRRQRLPRTAPRATPRTAGRSPHPGRAPALQAERDAVLALWQAVFGAGH